MCSKIKEIVSKKNKSKIVCLTAYSKNIAEIIDNHADIVLVGDSLGSVLYNYSTTRKVNLKMMLEHTKSVRMGVKKSLLIIFFILLFITLILLCSAVSKLYRKPLY